jgi:hypothetical protein
MATMLNIQGVEIVGTRAQIDGAFDQIKAKLMRGRDMVKIGPVKLVYVKEPPRQEVQRA